MRFQLALGLVPVFMVLGCSSTGGAGNGVGGVAGTAGSSGSSGAGGSGGSGGGSIDASAPKGGLVYAHTDQTLFSLDTGNLSLGLKQLGDFECIGGADPAMTDVAVDQSGKLWGVTATRVMPLAVANQMVSCGSSITLSQAEGVKFYALTFAPVGVLDPAKEVLVAGNTAGELWTIDDAGDLKLLGTLGVVPPNDGNGNTYANAGKAWELSGDIVFLANEGSPVGFATVRDCANPPATGGCADDDTLIEIDIDKLASAAGGSVLKSVRGKIVKRAGCADGVVGSYDNMYGIGAWADKVYGFSRAGYLVEVDLTDGTACLVEKYDGAKFSGAGVTTKAFIVAPPPK